jgi:quercetin dioxygenase-like cupin family protein
MTETTAKTPSLRASLPDSRWVGVERRAYKDEAGAPYKGVTRQTLASDPRLAGELRYFEVEPSGYTTLERHEHMHAVMILTGAGSVLVGDEVFAVKPNDLVNIAGWTWHQFRAGPGGKLGFLCLVDAERDRPRLPTREDLDALRAIPDVARFLDGA